MDLPREVPVMTLPSATLFPQALLPLYIFEPRYRRMLADSLKAHRMFIVAMQKPGQTRESPCPIAGLGLIRVSVDHKDGTSHLILQGLVRVELAETVRYKPYRIQRIRPLQLDCQPGVVIDALLAKLLELVQQRLEFGAAPFPFPMAHSSSDAEFPPSDAASELQSVDVLNYLKKLPSADQVADLVACALISKAEDRQALLETVDLETRLRHLIQFLSVEIRRHRKRDLD